METLKEVKVPEEIKRALQGKTSLEKQKAWSAMYEVLVGPKTYRYGEGIHRGNGSRPNSSEKTMFFS